MMKEDWLNFCEELNTNSWNSSTVGDVYTNAEITTMRPVFGSKRKPMNQLSKSSEKKYEGVSDGGNRV